MFQVFLGYFYFFTKMLTNKRHPTQFCKYSFMGLMHELKRIMYILNGHKTRAQANAQKQNAPASRPNKRKKTIKSRRLRSKGSPRI